MEEMNGIWICLWQSYGRSPKHYGEKNLHVQGGSPAELAGYIMDMADGIKKAVAKRGKDCSIKFGAVNLETGVFFGYDPGDGAFVNPKAPLVNLAKNLEPLFED